MKCDFCKKECDGKLILRDVVLRKEDGSDIILCSECLNNYVNEDYDKIKLFDASKEDLKEQWELKNPVVIQNILK